MARRGLRRGVAVLCAGAALLGAAGCSGAEDGRDGRDGEVSVETAAEACDDVSDETLALLRIEPPRTERCTWASDPDWLTGQKLLVSVKAYTPDEQKDMTATEAAESDFPPGDVTGKLGDSAAKTLRKLPGLGDEAVTFRVDTTTYRLFVRQRNVVVSVQADTAHTFDDASVVPPAVAETAVLAAAREVLDAAGVPLDDDELPKAPERAAGDVRRALPLCGALRAHGARLMPGVEPSAESPAGDAIRRCHWSVGEADARRTLFVEAAAFAPSVLTGGDGKAEASYALEQRAFGGETLDGLGDEAVVVTGAEDGNLYVRRGNLLVRVWYAAPGTDGDRLAAVESVARTVLARYE